MKSIALFASLALFTAFPATAAPKDDVIDAAKKLGDEPNYSWKTTVVVPDGAQFRPGPSEGKTEKDGFTHVSSTFGENTMQTVLKGDKGVITNQEGDWETIDEAAKAEGFGRFRALAARNLKTPAIQAAELAKGTKELKQQGDAYVGELTEEAAKGLLAFGRRGDNGPSVSDAKGSVKFWLKEGALAKYEFKVKGSVSFNGNDREVDRTTTIEIKDVGTTKVNVPEQAKKKLS